MNYLKKEPVDTNKEPQEWTTEEWDNHFETVQITDVKELTFEEFLLQEEGGQ